MNKVLIIDDDENLCLTIGRLANSLGMEAFHETSLRRGLERAESVDLDVVFLDVNLPDGDGLEGIERLAKGFAPPEIIIITGYGDMDSAEKAIVSGAWDYIEKSSSLQDVKLSLKRAIQYREQKINKEQRVALKRDSIVGSCEELSKCLDQVAKAAGSDVPVLITGETGTGKELFARIIHENSHYVTGDLIVVDCAALPEYLVESILFGHIKGAFTGADRNQTGLVLQADGGTLFLDEVGELPLTIQKKFLRVLQEKRFRSIGGKTEVPSNFRLVCATHRDLKEMVDRKQFREDLYFRIRATHIQIPPLRERIKDIPALALHKIIRDGEISGGPPHAMSPDFIDALQAYSWPGNVRELFNTIDRALAEAFGEPVLFPRHLPAAIRALAVKSRLGDETGVGSNSTVAPQRAMIPMKAYLETMKRRYIEDLLQSTNGDVPAACRISGLSRGYLYQLLKQFGIPLP